MRTNNASGTRIRQARELRGWTQADLAERAYLTKRAVQYIEAGQRTPTVTTFLMIAHALEVPAHLLVDGDQSAPEEQGALW